MTEGERRKNAAHELLKQHRAVIIRDGQRAMIRILLDRGEASADDVHDAVTVPDCINPVALGAVPGRLARAGIIVKSRYVRSRRPVASGRDIPVWRLIDRQGAIEWLRQNPPIDPPHDDQPRHQTTLFGGGDTQ